MDDFEEKKMVLNEKYFKFKYFKKIILKNNKVFNGYPCKIVTKYFCIFFCFKHPEHLFFILRKHFLVAGGGSPPPLAELSAKNTFFYVLPKGSRKKFKKGTKRGKVSRKQNIFFLKENTNSANDYKKININCNFFLFHRIEYVYNV